MAWYSEDQPEVLNFIVVGNHYSGHDLLRSSLSAHPSMVCHGNLLHCDEETRRTLHEDYFGDSGKVPSWYLPKLISVEHYLNNKVFDNNVNDEKAVGVQLSYANFIKNDLWDYADQKCRSGDFCILHMTRNPVACFVDVEQNRPKKSRKNTPLQFAPSWVSEIDPHELTTFVREHLANEIKINRVCGDRAVISYHELIRDLKGSLKQIFDFLEVPYSPACVPNSKQIDMRDIRSRIGNWQQLLDELPLDVLDMLESPTLF